MVISKGPKFGITKFRLFGCPSFSRDSYVFTQTLVYTENKEE